MKRTLVALLTLGISFSALTACTETPSMSNTYMSGDGTVTEFKPMDRSKAVTWSGVDSDGYQLGSENLTGVVTVLNFWYAVCTACRVETPDLVALSNEFKDKAQFVGVNVRDTADTANAFKRSFKVPFPTVMDASSGSVLLSFTGIVTPSAVPTTLVIDATGRVSARILGVAEKATLKALIKSALAEVTVD